MISEPRHIRKLHNALRRERHELLTWLCAMGLLKRGPDLDQQALDLVKRPTSNETILDLREVLVALERMVNGSYGRCEVCGGRIRYARLIIEPWAKDCRPCHDAALLCATMPCALEVAA
jgi:DnaK suppressor protein